MYEEKSTSKELEALNNLRYGGLVKDDVVCFTKKAFEKRLDIIETALKKLDRIENIFGDNVLGSFQTGLAILDFICNLREKDQKKLKTLKIIKEASVDIHNFKEFVIEQDWTYEQYLEEENDPNTSGYQFAHRHLTLEEFNLLKEVLK